MDGRGATREKGALTNTGHFGERRLGSETNRLKQVRIWNLKGSQKRRFLGDAPEKTGERRGGGFEMEDEV